MVTNRLNVDRMVSFPINKVVFMFRWPLYPHVSAIDAANDCRKASFPVKTFLHHVDFVLGRPSDELLLFDNKSSRHIGDYVGHSGLGKSNCVANYLQEAPAGMKTQSNKKLNHGCQGVITSRRSLEVVLRADRTRIQ